MDHYVLTLFVTGRTPRSRQAIDNLLHLCEAELKGRYQVQVIDVLEQPDDAEAQKILATPTVIRQSPPPCLRIIGDLSNAERVLQGLGLRLPGTCGRSERQKVDPVDGMES